MNSLLNILDNFISSIFQFGIFIQIRFNIRWDIWSFICIDSFRYLLCGHTDNWFFQAWMIEIIQVFLMILGPENPFNHHKAPYPGNIFQHIPDKWHGWIQLQNVYGYMIPSYSRCLSSKLSPKLNLFFCSNFL